MINERLYYSMINTEKSEFLTIYDENLNPIGNRTRAEVHANELLHQTIRLWTIQNNMIWFQKRSETKKLFPGRLDLSVTGHINPGESPETAVLRETLEETGLNLLLNDIEKMGGIPFPFMRPDGKLDNEFANIFIYKSKTVPCFRISEEVNGMVTVSVQNYNKLIRTEEPIEGIMYKCDPNSKTPPVPTGYIICSPNSFCCLNKDEWKILLNVIDNY